MGAMYPLVIGLVGCGGMGRRHLRAYGMLAASQGVRVELAAVCDPQPDAALQAARLAERILGSRPAVFSDHEQLIASDVVQALDVVTDPSTHHRIVVAALEHGVHVLCEKPLGVTVRACRLMLDAAARSGAVLATAENYRRDPSNRLARAVLDHGLLGEVHLMTETNVGGDDGVILSPWRHVREFGSIALDMGVHYTDIFRYYFGDLERVSGSAFVAEPRRVLRSGAHPGPRIEQVTPGVMRATGEDSLVALYETESGVLIQLSYLPSGPGRRWIGRTVHGRRGSMSVAPDRSGGGVAVQLGDRVLRGAELRRTLGGFALTGVAAALFGAHGTEYELPFEEADAALIAIELDDFVSALDCGRAPEVDGRDGLLAVAAVWAVSEARASGGAVSVGDVADGTVSVAQAPVDAAIGLGGDGGLTPPHDRLAA
jgi:predicted dehydrogenase